jgi:hypothetical protein
MDTNNMIPIRCPEEGCGGVLLIAEAFRDDHNDLIGLTCPKEHRFDYDKHRCPLCGAPADPARWDIVRASSFLPFPEGKVFKSAQCTSPDCDWEGPKG